MIPNSAFMGAFLGLFIYGFRGGIIGFIAGFALHFLINGGNDGSLIILNEGLYSYFYNTFTDQQWKPLEVKEWAKNMK